jgi:DeoR/GlpR family transcriptional regulator of sugar metabolism
VSNDLLYGAADDRRKRIVERVADTGFCSVAELSALVRVSEMTIRRDIRRLAEEGLVRNVHGGASIVAALASSVDFGVRTTQNAAAKRAIALHAATMVAPDSVIAIDAGTTTEELVRALPADLPFTAVTHSLPLMGLLAGRPGVQLIGLGGVFHDETQAFYAPAGLSTLHGLRAGTLFLATTSIHDDAIYAGNPYDVEMKRALLDISQSVVLVADSSKFATTALIRVIGLEALHSIVVDDGIDAVAREMCAKAGVSIIEVHVPREDGG